MDGQEVGVPVSGLVDLAAASMGGRVVAVSDEFFAEAGNLLAPGRGVFKPDVYTDRGKWMDGWESRRKRSAGFDECIVRLGVRGRVHAFDIDTNHFLGNHAPYASIEGASSLSDNIAATAFRPLLAPAALRPGSQNIFSLGTSSDPITHVRLRIYPDGGVARLRAYGEPAPNGAHDNPDIDPETRSHLRAGEDDLAALRNGGRALACSDMFFGSMNHLIAPGRARTMGEGWETRRRRGPGHDWIVVRLASAGEVRLVEIDTNHFKGNYPDRCSLDGIHAPTALVTDLVPFTYRADDGAWLSLLIDQELQANHRHFLLAPSVGALTHVRLSIFPDGGVSRLRVYGTRQGT